MVEEQIIIKCHNCKHEWRRTSSNKELYYVTCPNCRFKVNFYKHSRIEVCDNEIN